MNPFRPGDYVRFRDGSWNHARFKVVKSEDTSVYLQAENNKMSSPFHPNWLIADEEFLKRKADFEKESK